MNFLNWFMIKFIFNLIFGKLKLKVVVYLYLSSKQTKQYKRQ